MYVYINQYMLIRAVCSAPGKAEATTNWGGGVCLGLPPLLRPPFKAATHHSLGADLVGSYPLGQ